MFRSLLFLLLLILVLLFGFLVWIVMWAVWLFDHRAADRIAFLYVTLACRLGRLVNGVELEAEGLENLPKKGETAVYVMNHRSIFDIVISYPFFHDLTGFVAKEELGKIPVFSWWLTAAHCLFLNRTDIKKGVKTIEKGIKNVENGISMCIFPEGTRNRDREHKTSLLEFHGGSFKLATKTDVPVIPITLYNTSGCFEDQFPKMKKVKVKMIVGTPIDTSALTPKEKRFLPETVKEIIQETLNSCEK